MDGSWIVLNGSTQEAFHNKMLREHFVRRCFGSVSHRDTQRAFCKERLEERFALSQFELLQAILSCFELLRAASTPFELLQAASSRLELL